MQPFDPYHVWLGLPPEVQPPDFYQLLGLQQYESDINVIANAADQRMAHVKSFANGPYGTQSQQLLNEISQAKINLINPELRSAYDGELKAAIAAAAVAGMGESPKLAPADDLDDPIDHIAPQTPAAPTSQPVVDQTASEPTLDPVVEKVAPLVPYKRTKPAWVDPPPDIRTNTDFDVGVDHNRVRLSRKKSSSSSMLITMITAATVGTVTMLFIAKGCTDDDIVEQPNRPNTTVPVANKPKPKPVKRKPRPVDAESAIGDIAPAKPRPEPVAPPPKPPTPDPEEKADPADDPIASAVGGIAPPKPRRPRPQPGTTDIPEPEVTPETETPPDTPSEVLPPAFYGSLGNSFRKLLTNDYESYARQRDTAREKAATSGDPDAITAVDRLEQMELAVTKLWELVGISIEALRPTTEIETKSGAVAAVVEAAPDRIVLRVSGNQRRYLAERRGPMNVFPKMSSKLVLLLADRVNQKSPQAVKAIAFVEELGVTTWPKNDVELWKLAEEAWNKGGAPAADFFGLPPDANDATP